MQETVTVFCCSSSIEKPPGIAIVSQLYHIFGHFLFLSKQWPGVNANSDHANGGLGTIQIFTLEGGGGLKRVQANSSR